jgi:hypothetical protein
MSYFSSSDLSVTAEQLALLGDLFWPQHLFPGQQPYSFSLQTILTTTMQVWPRVDLKL